MSSPSSPSGDFSTEASKFQQTAADRIAEVKSAASEASQRVVNKLDANRGAAASGLESAASSLHENADRLPGGRRASDFGHAAADTLENTAKYVRTHNVKRMMADVETFMKRNPGASMIAAVAVGFIVGRAISRD